MISILAFDSKAIQSLFAPKFESYFNSEYPLIYKNKKTTYSVSNNHRVAIYKYYSAIDVAVENN